MKNVKTKILIAGAPVLLSIFLIVVIIMVIVSMLTLTESEDVKNPEAAETTIQEQAQPTIAGDYKVVPGYMGSPIAGVNVLRFVTSPFGGRTDPFTGKSKGHGGMDISYGKIFGTPVVSVADGTVTSVSVDSSYGIHAMIKHNAKYTTLYGHLNSRNVNVGDTVKAGQEIGKVGSTGRSTGAHLHFEVRVNGTRVNPAPFISGQAMMS